MKIAVSGKGGSGKTTTSATLARLLARQGQAVLAIDGDPNPNLAVALGIEHQGASSVPSIPRSIAERRTGEDGKARVVITTPIDEIVANHSIMGPDGVRVLVGSRVEHAGAG